MPATSIESKPDTTTRLMPMWKILLHNDDVNDMNYVCHTICEIFHFEIPKAVAIMMEAHETGCALVEIEPLEIAELRRDQLQAKGLTATIEPET